MSLLIPKKFETPVGTNRRTRRYITQLQRSSKPAAKAAAKVLQSCTDGEGSPCGSAACVRCGRELRLQWLAEVGAVLPHARAVYMVTLITADLVVKKGSLHTVDLKAAKAHFARLFRRKLPPNLVVLGAVDVSLGSFQNRQFVWQVHCHVLVLDVGSGPSISAARPSLRDAVSDTGILRPLRVDTVKRKKRASAVTYCLKSVFEWRSGYWKTKNLRGRAPHRATRGLTVPADAEVELRSWLARYNLTDRLVLVGVTNPAAPNHIRLRPTARSVLLKAQSASSRRVMRVTRKTKLKREDGRVRLKRARPRLR